MLRSMPFPETAAYERTKKTAQPQTLVNMKGPANLYTTSVHILVSASIKLSRKSETPPVRKVFRGLGRMKLGKQWFQDGQCGVELGFMSTTSNRDVALEYSGVKTGVFGTIFEFDVGSIDCGARLDSLSQYPGTK